MDIETRIAEMQKLLDAFKEEYKQRLSKPAFEVGKWYKGNESEKLWFIEKIIDKSTQMSYGISACGQWCNSSIRGSEFREFHLAADKEVEEALIKEAIKRGFKEGVKVSGSVFGKDWYTDHEIGVDEFSFSSGLNQLLLGRYTVFYNGKWAETIKDEPINIGGYEVKKQYENFTIGCKTISSHFLNSLKDEMNHNRFKTVSFDGHEVTIETIEKILKL